MNPRRLILLVPLALALVAARPAFATTRTVMNTADGGTGSLRAAIALAVPGDTIDFSLPYPATITLSRTLNIPINLTISGPGASNLTISGNDAVTVLHVPSGVTVGISGVTIDHGHDPSSGGGILNEGTLTLTDCAVSNNSTGYLGGGVYNNNGTLTLTGSSVSHNWANYFGGGVYNNGTLTLTKSTLSSNATNYVGGGVYNKGTLSITRSTVSDNSAPTGGGIFDLNDATLTLTESTVSGNSSGSDGGGIYNYGTATLTNSTVADNVSTLHGGGVYNFSNAALTVVNTTVSGNTSQYGGGIFNGNAVLMLKSSVVASNPGGNCSLSGGTAASDGYNLSDDTSCPALLNAATDWNNTPAGLDPGGLQDNGGPTKTIALLSGSPAVDAIPVADCTLADETTPVATDQRGTSRPQGSACDIGAFERVESVPFSFFSAKLGIHGGTSFDLNAKFTLGAGSDGIDPLTDGVTFQVGPYQATLPGNAFRQLQEGEKKGSWIFSGVSSNVWLAIQIVPLGGNSFQFKANGAPVNLAGVTNPVTVTLTFGQDTGTAPANADIDSEDPGLHPDLPRWLHGKHAGSGEGRPSHPSHEDQQPDR